MKFNFENIKNTFNQFNIYQKIAGVVLAVAIPASIGLGVSSVSANANIDQSSSISQFLSSIPVISSMVESSSEQRSSSAVSKKITLLPSSVEEDLEVQIVDEYGRMITGPEFELVVKGAAAVQLTECTVEEAMEKVKEVLRDMTEKGEI